jgi:uracil-DNA glycosylase family 4
MKPSGEGRKKILVVAEAPGKWEDRKGTQLIGPAGGLLRDVLEEVGIDLDRDCWKTNALICRPPNNRDPSSFEIESCRRFLFSTIEETKPKTIIILGRYALESLIGHRLIGRLALSRYSDWVGERIPDQELGLYICPVYHPSYVLRNEKDKVLAREWKRTIKAAAKTADGPFYTHNYDSDVEITSDPKLATRWLREAMGSKEIAFDYETTGLKPHRSGHRILCASISDGLWTRAFPFFEDEDFRKAWERLMRSRRVRKIAHKIDFEAQWTKAVLGYWPQAWLWDTQIGAHVLNNRKPTGLKFLAYTHYGMLGFDDVIDKYISRYRAGEDKKSGNAFNRLEDAPLSELLHYNGIDSLLSFKLYEEQKIEITGRLLEGLRFFIDGKTELARVQESGIRLDTERMKKEERRLRRRSTSIRDRLFSLPEIRDWRGTRAFSPMSGADVSKLLYRDLGYTKPDSKPTDETALRAIGGELPDLILRFRKTHKMLTTYIGQFAREEIDGRLHPFFNLHSVDTFRSSSDRPNFQNNPKRDAALMKTIRSLIVPSVGNRLTEYDYKSIEVIVAACYTKDEALLRYVTDDSTDMHRDQAEELFFLPTEKVTKGIRHLSKNRFVFPEFYGSTARRSKDGSDGAVAVSLWDGMDEELHAHVRGEGIRSFRDWQVHVEDVEDDFWNRRFVQYRDWKKATRKAYERRGYVDLYTGFRCHAPMSYTEITNYPIQGSAFHVLLWTLVHVMREARKRKMASEAIAQIHDSKLWDTVPEEEEALDELTYRIGTIEVRERWPWLIVPLSIEKEVSEINGSWAEMSEAGYLGG